jgi:hypothetical protein
MTTESQLSFARTTVFGKASGIGACKATTRGGLRYRPWADSAAERYVFSRVAATSTVLQRRFDRSSCSAGVEIITCALDAAAVRVAAEECAHGPTNVSRVRIERCETRGPTARANGLHSVVRGESASAAAAIGDSVRAGASGVADRWTVLKFARISAGSEQRKQNQATRQPANPHT